MHTHQPSSYRASLGVILAAMFMIGCPGPDGSPDGGEDAGTDAGVDGGADAGVDPAVTVTHLSRFHTREGILSEPGTVPRLLLPTGSGFVELPGAQVDAGVHRFPTEHAGPFYVAVNPNPASTFVRYLVTSSRNVDMSSDQVGSEEKVTLGTSRASAILSLSGLDSSAAEWDLQMVSVDPEEVANLTLDAAQPGAASIVDAPATVQGVLGRLAVLDGTGGPVQLRQRVVMDAGFETSGAQRVYKAVTRNLEQSGVVFDGGSPLEWDGTLSTVAQTSVSFEWRRAEFAATGNPDVADGGYTSHSFTISPRPLPGAQRWLGYSGELLDYYSWEGDHDSLVARWEYGNPNPDWEQPVGSFQYVFERHLATHDASLTATASLITSVSELVSEVGTRPIRPLVTAPRNLQVDDQPALVSRLLGASAPVISWEAPATGTASGYYVTISQLQPQAANPARANVIGVANFSVSGETLSLQVPPGLFTSGGHFVIKIAALNGPSGELTHSPFQYDQVPHAFAELMSGVLSVP